jgi:hypothetical protein
MNLHYRFGGKSNIPAVLFYKIETQCSAEQVINGHAAYATEERGNNGGKGKKFAFINEVAEISEQQVIWHRHPNNACRKKSEDDAVPMCVDPVSNHMNHASILTQNRAADCRY